MSNVGAQEVRDGAQVRRAGARGPARRVVRASSSPIRVLLADGQALFREAMRVCLNRSRALKVVGEVGRVSDLSETVARTQPDVVLTDLSLPDAPDGEVVAELKAKFPDVRTVVLTALPAEECLVKALAGGADGFILKDASCALVIKALRAVYAGETWVQRELIAELTTQLRRDSAVGPRKGTTGPLTQRERSVLSLLGAGKSTADIAGALFVSQSTVRVHLNRILEKLGLKNRIEAVRYAIKEGLVGL